MPTLGQPVPPRPAAFTPDGTPPGITWNPLPVDRPPLDEPARLIIVHTNAAQFRSTLATQRRLGLSDPDATKPTYEIGLDEHDGAEKWLRSDQRSIANGTVVPGMDAWDELTAQQRSEILEHGRSATFSLSIETIDLGWQAGLGGFSDYQGEHVARALAYESLVPPGFPLEVVTDWFGAGVGTHTWPFEFPFWTIHRGKTCPGTQKKADFREWVLPRAREIRAAWTAPPPLDEEDDMANSDEILAAVERLEAKFDKFRTTAEKRQNTVVGWLKKIAAKLGA